MPRTVPVSVIESPGQYITGAWQTAQVKAAIDFFRAVPVFYGYQTTTQIISNNTLTSFTIDTEVFDSDGGHSNTVNPSRYVPQVPGTYLTIGTSGWAGNATGTRHTRVTINGITIKGAGSGFDVNQAVTTGGLAIGLAACNGSTDYFEVQGLQTSGANLNTASAAEFACSLTVLWVSA